MSQTLQEKLRAWATHIEPAMPGIAKDLRDEADLLAKPLEVKLILSTAKGDTQDLAYVYRKDGAMAKLRITPELCDRDDFVTLIGQLAGQAPTQGLHGDPTLRKHRVPKDRIR